MKSVYNIQAGENNWNTLPSLKDKQFVFHILTRYGFLQTKTLGWLRSVRDAIKRKLVSFIGLDGPGHVHLNHFLLLLLLLLGRPAGSSIGSIL